jgi:hypothetical protein
MAHEHDRHTQAQNDDDPCVTEVREPGKERGQGRYSVKIKKLFGRVIE